MLLTYFIPTRAFVRITMKLLIVLAVVAVAVARPGDLYDSKYDDFNVDEVIANERLFEAYVKCFNDEGKCTPEGTEIKGWIPEAITSTCGRCTDKQKKLVAKTITATKVKYPAAYDTLMKKNNPDGKYDAALAEFLAKNS